MSVATADGTEVQVHGLRTVYFAFDIVDGHELLLGITFTICDVLEARVPFSNPQSTGVCSCDRTPQSQIRQG